MHHVSFNPNSGTVNWILSPFYKQGNRGSESMNSIPPNNIINGQVRCEVALSNS
jgi:hypothetical protein